MDGTKPQRILQPTEESGLQIRQLPGHDFADSGLFITPSAFRFMTFKQETIENEEKVVVKEIILWFQCALSFTIEAMGLPGHRMTS